MTRTTSPRVLLAAAVLVLIGLVVFAAQAFTQTPLTLDYDQPRSKTDVHLERIRRRITADRL